MNTETVPLTYNLFWVQDPYFDENWFVLAENRHVAEHFYAEYEGMILEECDAELICVVEEVMITEEEFKVMKEDLEKRKKDQFTEYMEALEITDTDQIIDEWIRWNENYIGYLKFEPRHAQLEDLVKLGFEIIDDGEDTYQRVVSLNGRRFSEGDMEKTKQLMQKRNQSF